MSYSTQLCGQHRPDLESSCKNFVEGVYPTGGELTDELWRILAEEIPSPRAVAADCPTLVLCKELLLQPSARTAWPRQLRQDDNFPGLLYSMVEWTELLQWMDTAPLGAEGSIQERLAEARELGQRIEKRVGYYLPLKAWFFREMARWVGMGGGDPLPWVERSLAQAARLGQWGEVARCRNFLTFSQTEASVCISDLQKRELGPLLGTVPYITDSSTQPELCSRLLTSLLQLVPMESALWLEKKADWEVLDWFPRDVTPRYSRRLVEQCLQTQELSWGKPDQLQANYSLFLSEVRSLIACPIGATGVLFAWQSAQQNWLSQDQVEAFQFLARLAGQLQVNLQLAENIQSQLIQSRRLHRRWQLVMENSAELGLAELDDEGRLLYWNGAFQRLFASVCQGQRASQLLPECDRWRDQFELTSVTHKRSRSRLVRLTTGTQPRWIQLTDWRVPEESGIFRAALDVSRHDVVHWFDHLEQMRHLLASNLHDGPAQSAAAGALNSPGLDWRAANEQVRYRLDFLRSPWVEGEEPFEWLLEYTETHFPESQIFSERQNPSLSRSQAQFLQRCRLGVLDLLKDYPEALQELFFASGSLTWKPAVNVVLPETLRSLLDCGTEVLGGSWSCGLGYFSISFDKDS